MQHPEHIDCFVFNGLRGSFGTPLLSFSVYNALFLCLYLYIYTQTDSRTLRHCAYKYVALVIWCVWFAQANLHLECLKAMNSLLIYHCLVCIVRDIFLETCTVYSVYALIYDVSCIIYYNYAISNMLTSGLISKLLLLNFRFGLAQLQISTNSVKCHAST